MSQGGDRESVDRSGVTLIVVTYQHERFVGSLLRSIDAQTVPPTCVILCDDASRDSSPNLLAAWAAKTPLKTVLLLTTTNRGLTATLNAALALVETPYYACIAGDDVMRADRLECQLAVLEQDHDLAFLYSDARVIDEEGGVKDDTYFGRHGLPADTFDALLVHNGIPAASAMVRTQAVRDVGGYDEDLFFEDYDLWLRLASRLPFGHIDEPLVDWRVVSTSMSARMMRPDEPEWAWARVRIFSKHWGRNQRTDHAIACSLRAPLIALALQRTPARNVAPYFQKVAGHDGRLRAKFYSLISASGSTLALSWLAYLDVGLGRIRSSIHRGR